MSKDLFHEFCYILIAPCWTWWPRPSPATSWRPPAGFTLNCKVSQEVATNPFQSSDLISVIWESQNAYVLYPLLLSEMFLLVFFKNNFCKSPRYWKLEQEIIVTLNNDENKLLWKCWILWTGWPRTRPATWNLAPTRKIVKLKKLNFIQAINMQSFKWPAQKL